MSKIVLSSGIRGIDWQGCLNAFAKASNSIVHYDNVLLNSKGKFDDLLLQTEIAESEKKTTKQSFKRHLSKLSKNKKSLVAFYSDPTFIEMGGDWQTLNNDNTFLFYFCSPEYFLAKCTADALTQEELLEIWIEDATRIWELYVRFPENTHVINIQTVELDFVKSARSVLTSLNVKRLRISKNAVANELNSIDGFRLLSFRIAQNIYLSGLGKRSDLSELYANLASVSVMSNDNLIYQENDRASDGLLKCKNLCEKLAKVSTEQSLERVELRNTITKQISEHENALIQISQLQKDLEFTSHNSEEQNIRKLKLETRVVELESLNEKINSQNQDVTQSINRYKSKCSELETENEFYKLKLSQLKQELEAVYIDSSEVKGANAELRKRADKIDAYMMKIEALSEQQRVELSKLKSRNGQLEAIRKDLISQKQSFVLQQGRLVKEIDNKTLIYEELVVKNSQLEANYAEIVEKSTQLNNKYNDLLKSNELAKLEIEKMQEASNGDTLKIELLESDLDKQHKQCHEELLLNTQLKSSISELKIERELLTIQVGNLQEELEYNFVQYQKSFYKKNTENNYLLDSKRLNSSLALMQLG